MSLSFLKKKNTVGIDIGHQTIQLVQIEKSGGGYKVTKAFTIPTPSDSVAEGVVTDPDAVGLTIKGAMREAKIGANSAVTAVSGGSVMVRVVDDMPKMTPDMLRKSIKYEAGRYVPQSVEDAFIEFEVLDDSKESTMDVMIVAVPKEVVNSRLAALSKAGLDVDVVDVESFAMYRALVESNESSILNQMTIAMVDIGAHMTTVSVVTDGMFSMTRTIPQGSAMWTDALKDHFGLEFKDAEVGKSQLDLTILTSDQVVDNAPLRVIQPHVDDLIREVRRSLNYYQSQQKENGSTSPVTHLVISGGGSKLKGLAAYFSHKLGLEVSALGVFDNPKFVSTDPSDDSGLDYSVAAGLAMRSFLKSA